MTEPVSAADAPRDLVLRAEGVHKTLGRRVTVEALRGVDLAIGRGEFVAIIGPSGSGKSTLLYLLGALDRPTAGQILIEDTATTHLDDRALARLRGRAVGFVFQHHFLLNELTALENVAAPLRLSGVAEPSALARAGALLDAVGLADRAAHRPAELSGGQLQRVAVARALAPDPLILLGDEPTGNLDRSNAFKLYELLRQFNREQGQTVVVVTHDLALAGLADRCVELVDGLVKA